MRLQDITGISLSSRKLEIREMAELAVLQLEHNVRPESRLCSPKHVGVETPRGMKLFTRLHDDINVTAVWRGVWEPFTNVESTHGVPADICCDCHAWNDQHDWQDVPTGSMAWRLASCQVQDSLTGFGYTSGAKRTDIGSGGTGRDWSISFAIGLCQGIGDDERNRPIDFCLLSSFLNHLGYALIVVFWDPGGFWHPAGLPTATWGTSNAAVGRSSAKCEGKLHRRCSGMLSSFVL